MEIINICSYLLFDKCAFISVMNYRGFPLVILKRNICFKARILMFKGVYAIYPSIFTLVK